MKPLDPNHGLPGPLPAEEHILWQGQPVAGSLARQVFHLRAVLAYFAILLAWAIGSAIMGDGTWKSAVSGASWVGAVGLAGAVLLVALARLLSATTVYTITSSRVIFRYGVALPMTVDIPFKAIESASVRAHADGTGDIPLVVSSLGGLGFIHLWPNVRPWHVSRPQPMLRSVPDALSVARVLADAIGGTAQAGVRSQVQSPQATSPQRSVGSSAAFA